MTAGNNGASTPEDDDPFGYLYADGQASGATPPSGGGGYGYPGPRSSYNRVRTVGERQYGQQQGGGYGYPPAGGQQGYGAQQGAQAPGQAPQQGYHQPNAHYQAPETLPGGSSSRRGGDTGGRGRGPNTKGLLIGAIAVVAAVVIGIGVAMIGDGDDDKGDDAAAGPSQSDTQPSGPSQARPPKSDGAAAELPKADAKSLRLAGGAAAASDVEGAKAGGGVYVGGLNQVGAAAIWTVNGIEKSGKYTLHVNYGVPGKDATMTLTVNGKAQTTPLKLKNWAQAQEGDWAKGWTSSYAYIELTKGTNTIKISCEQGNQCDANLDQVWLEKGWRE